MKRTFLDRFIGVFSPRAELQRIKARAGSELTLRAYDIAKSYPTSDWSKSNANSANAETKAAIAPGRQKARALVQNNPYAIRAVNVIVSNTVGAGIIPKIVGKNPRSTKKLNELWKKVAESTKVDAENRHNFYGLQALILRSTVESGEGLGRFLITPDAPKVQLFESDLIVTTKDEGKVVQGVELGPNGQRLSYHLYKTHPGSRDASQEIVVIPADQISHVYKQERPGQVRGITWAHPVVEKINDFSDYQDATLIRQKIAACFTAFVTTSGSDSLIDADTLKEKRQNEFALEPATVRYLRSGEDIKIASPPGVEGFAEFNRESLRAIAMGFGISYESITGDYSQSNYSSSRLGHLEMRRNIEMWRWNLLIPQFCEPYFQQFLNWAKLQGIDTTDARAEWVPPAAAMIDPTKEVEALKKEVRAGFKTYGQAVREQGLDPEETLVEIAQWNQKFDDLKISLDSDPRRMSTPGFAQPEATLGQLSDAEYVQPKGSKENQDEVNDSEENQEDASAESDTSAD